MHNFPNVRNILRDTQTWIDDSCGVFFGVFMLVLGDTLSPERSDDSISMYVLHPQAPIQGGEIIVSDIVLIYTHDQQSRKQKLFTFVLFLR